MKYPTDQRELKETEKEQAHSVILRMLRIIDMICKRHDIDYWLDYGTLLGAVRHQGFIPWDHEADIGMLRPDFELFLQVINKELPDDMFVQTPNSDRFFPAYPLIECKIRDSYSDYLEEYKKYPNLKWHNGIQVDIFVYDVDDKNRLTNGFERYFSKARIHLKFEEIEHTITKYFEGFEFPVPIGYESYLTRAYGDYTQLPPKEQQIFPKVSVFSPCNHPASKIWKPQFNQ